MEVIKIIIVDDHPMIREGLKYVLEQQPNMEVIDEASNGEEAIEKILEKEPDVVLLDINMPVLNGRQVVDALVQKQSSSKFILLTGYDEIESLPQMLGSGVSGYIQKGADTHELISAVKNVYQGETYIQPTVAARLIKEIGQTKEKPEDIPAGLNLLTKRELEVLKLIAKGLINAEIAEVLNISEETIKNHVSKIFRKINVNDRTNAAIYAIKHNLVEIE